MSTAMAPKPPSGGRRGQSPAHAKRASRISRGSSSRSRASLTSATSASSRQNSAVRTPRSRLGTASSIGSQVGIDEEPMPLQLLDAEGNDVTPRSFVDPGRLKTMEEHRAVSRAGLPGNAFDMNREILWGSSSGSGGHGRGRDDGSAGDNASTTVLNGSSSDNVDGGVNRSGGGGGGLDGFLLSSDSGSGSFNSSSTTTTATTATATATAAEAAEVALVSATTTTARGPQQAAKVSDAELGQVVSLILEETETLWLLDMPGTWVDRDGENASAVIEATKKYEAHLERRRDNPDAFSERPAQTFNNAPKSKTVQTSATKMSSANTQASGADIVDTMSSSSSATVRRIMVSTGTNTSGSKSTTTAAAAAATTTTTTTTTTSTTTTTTSTGSDAIDLDQTLTAENTATASAATAAKSDIQEISATPLHRHPHQAHSVKSRWLALLAEQPSSFLDACHAIERTLAGQGNQVYQTILMQGVDYETALAEEAAAIAAATKAEERQKKAAEEEQEQEQEEERGEEVAATATTAAVAEAKKASAAPVSSSAASQPSASKTTGAKEDGDGNTNNTTNNAVLDDPSPPPPAAAGTAAADVAATKQQSPQLEQPEEPSSSSSSSSSVPPELEEAKAVEPEPEPTEPHICTLLRYSCAETAGYPATSLSFNGANTNVLAVGHGDTRYNTISAKAAGFVCCWTMKNPSHPERVYKTPHAVTCLAFSRSSPNLLAVGLADGTIALYDVRRDTTTVSSSSSSSTPTNGAAAGPVLDSGSLPAENKHAKAVRALRWVTRESTTGGEDGQEVLVSTGDDGRVLQWTITKGLRTSTLMVVPRVVRSGEAEPVAGIARTSGVHNLLFNPRDANSYLVGTADGNIHACSCTFSEQFQQSYTGHTAAVYGLDWYPFSRDTFLSCSADWSLRLWKYGVAAPRATLQSEARAITAATWSPHCATTIASVSGSQLCLWDIALKSQDPVVIEESEDGASLCSVAFCPSNNTVVTGDANGAVTFSILRKFPTTAATQGTSPSEQGNTLEALLNPKS